jgi:hypothetical protein
VTELPAQLYGYLDAVMPAVPVGLTVNDYKFAYQLLKDLGIVPSEAAPIPRNRKKHLGRNALNCPGALD